MLEFTDYPISVVTLDGLRADLANDEIVSDEEVWSIAKESYEIPNFSNIYISLVYSKLESFLTEAFNGFEINIDYYVNCLCSSFFIDGTEIDDAESLKSALLEEAKKWRGYNGYEEFIECYNSLGFDFELDKEDYATVA